MRVSATPAEAVAAAAAELHRARLDRTPVPPLTSRWEGLATADAYAVQAAGLDLRRADGERVVGGKLGFTSEAMRRAMGVDAPNYGWLTDAMWLRDGIVALERFIHPKVEPEIAFVLGADLVAPVTVADVLAATAAVAPCLEVVDSRYVDFVFTAVDNIADNSSAGGVALGDPVPLDGIDLRLLGVVVSADGDVVGTAAGAAAHDHPAAAVAWMANHCGSVLPAGSTVISGGLTAPVDLSEGTVVVAEFDRLGAVRVVAE